jgi:hypothetical protein
MSRRKNLEYTEVLEALAAKGISIRVASPKLVMEEAPESYKDVTQVRRTPWAVRVARTSSRRRCRYAVGTTHESVAISRMIRTTLKYLEREVLCSTPPF